jgi:hypothetical protein
MCQDWPQSLILLILASKVARITGVSHWHPVKHNLFLGSYKVTHLLHSLVKTRDNFVGTLAADSPHALFHITCLVPMGT